MRIAIPIWHARVSPVFDVAGQLLVVDLAEDRETHRQQYPLTEMLLPARVELLVQLRVDTLICGAISQTLEEMLLDRGIRVIARVCGEIEEILAAYQAGQLGQLRFAMPGCRGQPSRPPVS